MSKDPIVDELQSLTDEMNAITDKGYDENNNVVPGRQSDEDKKRVREIQLRLREIDLEMRD